MRENILYNPDHVRNRAIKILIEGDKRRTNPSQRTERVSGAGFIWRGYEYRSTIQRRQAGRVTAYGSTHELIAQNLFEKNAPGFVLKYLHALEVNDGGEKVTLQSASLEAFNSHDEVDLFGESSEVWDSVEALYLVRGGMVFSEDAIPEAEKDRMVKLFNL